MLKFKGILRVLRKFFQGLCRNEICSNLLVEGMFALQFFCQGTHCPPPGMIKLANMPVCLGLIIKSQGGHFAGGFIANCLTTFRYSLITACFS